MPLIAFVSATVLALAAQWLIRATNLSGLQLPEMHPEYSASDILRVLSSLSPARRDWYTRFQLVDLLLIAGVAGAMVAIDRWSLDRMRSGGAAGFIVLLPLAYAAFDLAEDIALVVLVRLPGDTGEGLGGTASALTRLKFLLLATALVVTAFVGIKALTAG